MWGILFKTILVLLAIVGLTEVFRLLSFRLLRTKNCGRVYWVLSFRGHDKEAELALKNAVEHLRWLDSAQERLVLCVDRGMDEETRRVCRCICRENLDVRLCTPEEAAKILEQPFANT